jgi:hypothetical protein
LKAGQANELTLISISAQLHFPGKRDQPPEITGSGELQVFAQAFSCIQVRAFNQNVAGAGLLTF